MDHQWRPPPIQGNICPTCSISHFPFCHPPPYPGRYAGSSFGPNSAPMNISPPVYHAPGDPYNEPGYWNRNPSLPQMGEFGNLNRGRYPVQDPGFGDGGYVGSEYNMNDRSSKRLRVDGAYPGSYGSEGDGISLNVLWPPENERRLKLVHDHGGPNPDFGLYRDVRGYGQESSCFDRNVDARVLGISSSMGGRSNPDMEYVVNNQREEIGYQPGYGSHHGMKRSVSDVQDGSFGNKFNNLDHQLAQYGQGAKPPDPVPLHQGVVGHDKDSQYHGYPCSIYGSSHVPNDSSYSNNFEPRHPNNAPLHYEPRSNASISTHYSDSQPPFVNTMHQPGQMRYDYNPPSHFNDGRQPLEARSHPIEGYQGPYGNQHVPMQPHYGPAHGDNRRGYANSFSENMGHFRASQGLDVRPPLPASPPPPLPMEPSGQWTADHKPSSSPPVSSSLFPVAASSSNAIQSSYAPTSEFHMRAHSHLQNSHILNSSRGMFQRDSQATLTSSGHYARDGPCLPSKNSFPDKPKILDASHLFKPPHRATRPDHFVIVLRGLPGSGKSYLAKMLRDLEVEHGGNAPRIHSMDDYFMTEVEKAEENETSKSSVRGKKPIMKVVLEYCYEPEMEEAYRASMLKAFKKTLEEGVFTFVIVDDRNLRAADFAQFWATAKRSGYEVYVLEAPYKDPAGCTARNVHGFTQDDVEKMAAQWEEAPALYLQLDVKSLFHGDDLAESNIQEVDMDTEDGDFEGGAPGVEEREPEKIVASSGGNGPDVSPKHERSWDADGDNPTEVKDLGRSKWSSNLDDEDDERTEVLKGKPNVLSGLLRTYGKEGKSVNWGDQGGHTGFSIGAVKKANAVSLVIGPGAGYSLKSNPMPEDDVQTLAKSGETRKHNVFKERLRAEQESFKAVFDRRRHRIGGLDVEEE